MGPKLLAFMTWIFYIAERRTADDIWFFCMIYSATLAVCTYLFQREQNAKGAASARKTPAEK